MSKVNRYIELVNATLGQINLATIENDDVIDGAGKTLAELFNQVYGDFSVSFVDCSEDEGFAIVPAIIQTSQNKRYLGLIEVSVEDSGEHYDTIFLTVKGAFHQGELSEKEKQSIIPYQYKPLVEIVGDIHVGQYC
jgi:hypothetical protein